MSEIEARREARRRKILENSSRRLQKITGVEERNGSFDLYGYKSSLDSPNSWSSVNNETQTIDTEKSQSSLSDLVINYKKYHMVLLVLIAFSVNVSLDSTGFLNTVFLPFIAFEIINCAIKAHIHEDEIDYNEILTLFGIQQRYFNIFKYLAIVKNALKDLLIYFFVSVCVLAIRSIYNQSFYKDFVI
ncbi:hypothetical protein ABEB36_009721 [Hypothenemus hampei]|uniref:Uncharacterized protein n=1 Tax=Hypothenemus hampei TaxID=57062 RepID=A0ABD1EJE5_HYPHA